LPPSSAESEPHPELTRRELEILRLVAGGANTRVMADRLHVSPATVRNHVQHILAKLGVHSRLEAAAYATRHRLL
jgi:DNA-binding NarL/FixJ family response regulator